MQPQVYGPFPYSPLPRRARWRWPSGQRLMVWVIPNVEFFPLTDRMPGGAGNIPDVYHWAQRDYGARVGIWRLMEVLDRFRIRATVALNADVCDLYPQILEAGMVRNWEFMGHNAHNTQRLSDLDPVNERVLIHTSLDRIREALGTRPRGWLGSGLQETWHTLEFLAEAGIEYVADWVNDDQPYWMEVGGHRLISVPYSVEINDKPAYEVHHRTPEEFCDMIRRQFDCLYEESQHSPRVMAIALHPYLSGVPHRIGALVRALEHIDGHAGVVWATGYEIAEAFRAVVPPPSRQRGEATRAESDVRTGHL